MLLKPEKPGDALWDRMPRWLRVITVCAATVYFGGALVAPLFWRF